MAGLSLPTIDPSTDTGTDLADALNLWTPYLASTRIVTNGTRPPEVTEGGLWFRGDATAKALMITVRDDVSGTGTPKLSDKVLFNFGTPATGGAKVYEGVEIFVDAIGATPSTPAQDDLWAIPDGVSEGSGSATTNWRLRIYNSGAWADLIPESSANIMLSATLGVEPALGEVNPYYGTLWMDALKDAASPNANNGLKVWNGSAYVPSWPVIAGETMLKTTSSNSDPAASGWAIGKAHINNATGAIFMSTDSAWIEITDKINFVTDIQDAIDNITIPTFYEALNPFYSWNLTAYYRNLNAVQQFSVSRWGDLVETIGAGANIGKIDTSLTVATGLGYQSTFTAVADPGDEYPPLEVKGNYYIYLNDPSFTFTVGDLIGQTIYKGQGVIFNNLGSWEIIDVVLNTDLFVHRDGSLPVYAALPFTTSLGASEMNLDYQSILFASGITFSITSTAATGDNGLHVSDAGEVGIGMTTPDSPLVVSGASYNTPSRDNNLIKITGATYPTVWMGIRHSVTDGTWCIDSEYSESAFNMMSLKYSNGYVGIGVTAPTAKLDVAGVIKATGNIATQATFAASSGTNLASLNYQSLIFTSGTTFSMTSNVASGDNGLHISDAGEIGIGNTSPDAPLVVTGSSNSTPSRDNSIVKITGAVPTDQWLGFRHNNTSGGIWCLDTEYSETSYNAISIKQSNGYVGFNVADPAYRVDIDGTVGVTDLVSLVGESWEEVGNGGPSYSTNWTGHASSPLTRFRKFPDGTVHLSVNAVCSVAMTTSFPIFYLPAGYRPTDHLNNLIGWIGGTGVTEQFYIDKDTGAVAADSGTATTDLRVVGYFVFPTV